MAKGLELKPFAIVFSCILIGVLFAILFQMWNSSGLLIPLLIGTGMTLGQLQFLIIFACTFIGIILAIVFD